MDDMVASEARPFSKVRAAMMAGEYDGSKLMEIGECSYGVVLRVAKAFDKDVTWPKGFWGGVQKKNYLDGNGIGSKKADEVAALLRTKPDMLPSQIAAQVGCATALVYKIAKRLEIPITVQVGEKQAKRQVSATPESINRLRAELVRVTEPKIEFVAMPAPSESQNDRMARIAAAEQVRTFHAKRELVKLLEEVFARQRRIWGDWV